MWRYNIHINRLVVPALGRRRDGVSDVSVLRRDSDQALRLLLALGDKAGHGGCVPVRTLATAAGVPVSLAHKCVQRLRQAGMLTCRRGVAGGVALTEPLARIRVLDAITAVQGRPAVCRCTVSDTACSRRGACRLSRGLIVVQERLDSLLSGMTVADLSGVSAEADGLVAAPAAEASRRRKRRKR